MTTTVRGERERTPHPSALVVDSDVPVDRIDYQRPGTPTGERAVPYHCPYCADEDLRPLGTTPGAWHCRTCTRMFSVTYLGMAPPAPAWPPDAGATPYPTPTGATR